MQFITELRKLEHKALQDRQEKLLVSAELKQFLQDLDENQLWLRKIQSAKLFHEAKQLDAMMGRQERRLIDKDLLQHASTGQLQTFLDQQTQMIEAVESYRGSVESFCELGRQLIRGQVAGMVRIEQKVFSLKHRYANLCAMVHDRKCLLLEWITFRDMLQEIDLDVVNTIVQHPKLADRLKIKLSEITSDWDELRRRMRDRIACMVQMHRAIIFEDGCLRLDLWLKTFAEKLSLDVGRSLLAVNHLIRRHRSMLQEVAVRDAHVESLLKEADSILIQWQTRLSTERIRTGLPSNGTTGADDQPKCGTITAILCAASFASEADAAEQWLEVHEADLHLNETGDSIQSTVALIQRHEALEHNLLLQAERFERLKRPTQMELLDTTPADYSVLGKAASRAVVSEETLSMILAVPTVDSMLREFGLEAEIDSTAKDHADHQEAIVIKSSDEELDSIVQAVYTENMGDLLSRKHDRYGLHETSSCFSNFEFEYWSILLISSSQ
ncbi:unnamed protein product [Fasciola hepatica]|uniref:Spectrin repeat-containing domain protein n=1 Tax=Fasciola hepatica TaxID=6192 RepID=A0ABC9HGT8_FASHE